MRKKLSFVMAVVMLATMSCSKDKNEVTKENLAATYKTTVLTYQLGTATPIDALATLQTCEKDDTQKLNTDLTYNYIDAGTKCSPTGDYSGTWSLPSSSQIIIDGDTYTIKSFDGRTLMLTQTETFNGMTYTVNSTMVKQ